MRKAKVTKQAGNRKGEKMRGLLENLMLFANASEHTKFHQEGGVLSG